MGQWSVIPGGWSVSVEFTFYAMFPVIATLITTLRRAIAFTFGATSIAILANFVGFYMWSGTYSSPTIGGFLLFLFPNQFPVFALGTVVYFLIGSAARSTSVFSSNMFAFISLCWLFALNWAGFPSWAGENSWILGISQAAALPFALFVLALSRAPQGRSLFVNPLVALIGKISFSAYLLHFAAIELILGRFPLLFRTGAGGVSAIAAFAAGWLAVTTATCVAAFITHQFIEQPFIALGRGLIHARRLRLAPIAVRQ